MPDLSKSRLALSGIELSAPTQGGYGRFEGAATAAATLPASQITASVSSGLDDEDPQAAAAVRRFHQGSVMKYCYTVFNARSVLNAQSNKRARPQINTQVRLERAGKIVFAGSKVPLDPISQTDFRRLIAGGTIRLGSELLPGEYVLRIIIKDVLTNRIVTQLINLEIVN